MSKPNPEQQKVIETTESPLLVIAGPGAGKTKTLVDRVIYLIKEKKVSSENIMVATFTEKAAKELISRISTRAEEENIAVNLSDMYIGTLHSIFLEIIEECRLFTSLNRNYRVLDDFEQKYFVYRNIYKFRNIEDVELLFETKKDKEAFENGEITLDELLKKSKKKVNGWSGAEKICNLVNKVAEENLDLEKLSKSKNADLKALGNLTKEYRDFLETQNALDFSLIQSYMWNLLSEKKVLSDLRKKIQYIMVDEYQDTNHIQEQILLKIAAPKNRICVVGDDDQALYRFRGATVENILRFQEKFSKGECQKIELNKNYRSHPDIIDFYNKFMSLPYEEKKKNGEIKATGSWDGDDGERYRYSKQIKNAGKQNRKNSPYFGVVSLFGEDETEWKENFLSFITKLKKSGKLTDYNQCAFLCKSVKNEKVKNLVNFLEANGIPVFSPRSKMFFDRYEVKLVFGCFVFIFRNLEELVLGTHGYRTEIWDYYDKCKETFVNELRSKPSRHKELQQWAAKKSKELTFLKSNTDYTFANMFYQMIQFSMFADLLNVELSSGVQDLRPVYNLSLLSKFFSQFEYLNKVTVIPGSEEKRKDILSKLFNEYFNFLYDGGIEEYEDYDMVTPKGCISFMTIHQSKGLQFPITFVDSLDNSPSKDYTELDEEINKYYYKKDSWEPLERTKYFDFWRLYYTAFSRAQNLLVLTGINNLELNAGGRSSPSKYFVPFVKDLPEWQTLFRRNKTELEIEEVKESDIKQEYSFTSHILVYENCPVQYKFFKELEFSPVRTNSIMFGSLVHQTIEDIHRKVLEGNTSEITKENIRTWVEQNYFELSRHEGLYLREGTRDNIAEHVQRYVDYASKDWSIIKEAEVPVSLQKETYILEGQIDLIQGKGDTVEILDFKSGDKPDVNTTDKDERECLDRYKRQLEIYSHIVEQRYGKKVSRMHLFYTAEESGNPLISYNFDSSAINQTINHVTEVVEKIESKNFKLTSKRKGKQCTECDLKCFCDRNCK